MYRKDRRNRNGHQQPDPRAFAPAQSYGKVARNQIHPGVLINAHIPYREDVNKSKLRPAIVVEVTGRTYKVCAIYSKTDGHRTRREISMNSRRSYIDLRPVAIDFIDVVSISTQPVPEEVLAWLNTPTITDYTPTTTGASPTMTVLWAK